MKTRIHWILTLLMIASMVLAACGGGATPTEVMDEPAAPAEQQTEEPVEPSDEMPVEASEADLDAAFTAFLANMEGYNTIGLDALNELLIDNPPFLLDVRNTSETETAGYIPGSVTIPLRELGDNLAYLPSFDTPIVSYCGSGWRCTIALTGLGALGWDVKGLKGGSYGGWVDGGYETEAGLPPDPEMLNAAQPDEGLAAIIGEMFANVPDGYGVITAEGLNTALVENPDLILIDVRRAEELSKGIIDADNNTSIPLEDFIANKALWPADKDAPIVVYCGSGHRSTIAMTILWSYGYTNVSSLKDGFGGWVDAGYPVAGGEATLDAAYADFLASMEGYNTISLDALNEQLIDNPPFLLDVRNTDETEAAGYIPGSVTIPLRELGDNLAYLPSFDTPIVSYCGSGWRCTIALTGLGALGWDVKGLKGSSYGGWVDGGYETVAGLPPDAEMLNAAEPDANLAATIGDMFANVPDGYGVITADNFNTALLEDPDLVVIDVRRSDEVAANGVIEAANYTNIPLEDFIANKALWPADKDATIVVYCGSGHRSTIAMTILWSYGYTNVSSLKDGFGGWVEAGYPVVEYAVP